MLSEMKQSTNSVSGLSNDFNFQKECETSGEVSEKGTDGAQGKLPQEAQLFYADYFELKTIRTQRTQEEYLSFPFQTT